jgi:hypothetical protein
MQGLLATKPFRAIAKTDGGDREILRFRHER